MPTPSDKSKVLSQLPPNSPLRKSSKSYLKGQARREALINSTIELLSERELDDIALKDIAAHAGIPVGSAYHFFANAMDVYVALAQQFTQSLALILAEPYLKRQAKSWQQLLGVIIDRAAKLYDDYPAYRKLILSGKAPADIKLADRVNDEEVGKLLIAIFSRHFEFPEKLNTPDVFYFATEMVDLMFSLSVIRHGDITAKMTAEAKLVAVAYLERYLPESLSVRE